MIYPVDVDRGRYRKYGRKYGNFYHCGHDFDCPEGTFIQSIGKGIIAFMGDLPAFGSWNPSTDGGVIIIKHGDVFGIYGHIKFADELYTGNTVGEGRVLGTVDKYHSSGEYLPHLHFCIYKGNNICGTKLGYVSSLKDFMDPLKYIKRNLNGVI